MNTEILPAGHPVALRRAEEILKAGGLVVFPTDTVYGLAALPDQAGYVESLFIAKGRDTDRAIAVLIGLPDDLQRVSVSPGAAALRLAERFWPGPLTLVLPRHPSLPDILSPNLTIGVRMPDHPVALDLLRRTGPLAVTSANLSGQANTSTAQEALSQLKGRVQLIIDGGPTPGGVPSTVVDCTGAEMVILREGPVSKEALVAALDQDLPRF